MVGRIAVVTMNGAMGGGAGAVVYNLLLMLFKRRTHMLDIGDFTAGILGGNYCLCICLFCRGAKS